MNASIIKTPIATSMLPPLFPLPREFAAYAAEPLRQRPAGSPGKHGVCQLSFASVQGITQLRHSFVSHPFHLTAPWRLDPALPGMAVVYIQTPAGGLIQGDRARMQFLLAAQAQVHLTTQAAEKIHTMTANCALQHASFSIGAGAYAEYCPEPVILFPGARFAQEIDVILAPEACFFLSDIVLSRRAADGALFDALASTVRVRAADGALLLHDRSIVLPQQQRLNGPGVLGEHRAWGTALLIGPSIPQHWLQEVEKQLSTESDAVCGVTALPKARGICVKAVGAEARAVRRAVHRVWDYLRRQVVGAPAPSFPK